MNKTVDVSKPLTKITTTIGKNEYSIYSIEWFFVDGSYQRVGKEDPDDEGGRSKTIEFAPGEILLGAVMHHDEMNTYGIEWITGRQQ